MKILIIDDEPLIRMALARVFQKRGYQVFEASDGLEGLKIWQQEQPSLVLLDWIMPNMNGNQLLQKLKNNHMGAIVHVMSAYTNETNIEELKDLGVKSFISKPFDNVLEIIKQLEDSLDD
jgi:two-component system, response regulator, stage 0 sporulation protein F